LLLLLLVGETVVDHLLQEEMPLLLVGVVHMVLHHLFLEIVGMLLPAEMVPDTLFQALQLITQVEEELMVMQLSVPEDKVVVEQVELQTQ
jgi:hypothetical protein